MNHSSDLIDELVREHVKPDLKELGFKCKASTFFRQNGELTEVIAPQKSKWNEAQEAKFTVNLGVYWPSVQETLDRACKSFPPKEYECTLRQRLGPLFDQNRDFWWTVTPQSDVAKIGMEVAEKIKVFALPWLYSASSLDEVVKIAHTNEAAVFHVMKGERAEASALIEEAINKTKLAKPFLRSLAAKLGLEISALV